MKRIRERNYALNTYRGVRFVVRQRIRFPFGDAGYVEIAMVSNITNASIQVMREAVEPKQFTAQFPPLESVTKPHLTTCELAYYTNMAKQTWRTKACDGTAPEGLQPLRICRKLAWPTVGAKRLLGVTV